MIIESTNSLGHAPMKLRQVNQLKFAEFSSACANFSTRDYIRQNILQGDVYIIQSVLPKDYISILLQEIIKHKLIKSKQTKIVDGVSNIYYESLHYKKSANEYTAIDKSWYFFPWNHDSFKLGLSVQPIFNNVILLNNRDPNEVIKLTPKDGVVQRFHLINYPIGQGQISLHTDPVNVSQVNSGIYFTECGTHYKTGGFFVIDSGNNKVFIDQEVSIGDMVLFYPGLLHGVAPVSNLVSGINSDGRFFFNMNLVQSHEVNDRLTTHGYQ
jgi:hypothetical protein